MIEVRTDNLFDARVRALVNPVNCEGVMGKGLALEFKNRFSPEYFKEYERDCKSGRLAVGRITAFHIGDGRYVVNFPTKNRWRSPSRMEYIDAGLRDLVAWVRLNAIESIAIPALGCGLGGLSWNTGVKPRIEAAFAPLDGQVDVWLFAPERK